MTISVSCHNKHHLAASGLTWDAVPEVFLEPTDERVERVKHLGAVSDSDRRDCGILILGCLTRHVGDHELARVLLAGTEVVRDPGIKTRRTEVVRNPGVKRMHSLTHNK